MAAWLLEQSQDKALVLNGSYWKRDPEDKQVYRLFDKSGYRVSKVWKAGGLWGCFDGNCYKTLKEAKTNGEDCYVSAFHNRMQELVARLQGLKDGATSDSKFTLLPEEYCALERLLDVRLDSAYKAALLQHGAGLELLDRNRQPWNSLQAISRNDTTLYLLRSRLIFRSENRKRVVLLDKMEIWGSLHRDGEAGRLIWRNGENYCTVILDGLADHSINSAADYLVSEGIAMLEEQKAAA